MTYASMWYKTNFSKQMATHYIEKYIHKLKWTGYKENILEVGCAEGSITNNILYPQIKNHVGKLLATDKLEGMIDLAKKENKIPQIDYQVLDVIDPRATQRYRNQFDHIFSFLVAHFILDTRHFFTTLRDMLKPNGQIFVTAFPDNFVMQCFRKQFEKGKWKRYAPETRIFADYTEDPEKHVREVLRDAGFEIDVCEAELGHYQAENLEDLIRALLHMFVSLGVGSAVIKEDFVQEMYESCATECTYLGTGDKYEMPLQQLFCIATKIAK